MWAIAIAMLLWSGVASADVWPPPAPKIYESANGAFRLTVTRRAFAGALPYFRDKVSGRSKPGQDPASAQRQASGLLERRDDEGRWIAQWSEPLVNDVAPVDAVVANSGEYVVTFDNWHSTGLGDHVVVIYDGEGQLVRSLRLDDFLPPEQIAGFHRTASSLWWSGKQRISDDSERLILQVLIPPQQRRTRDDRYVDVEIVLATGEPVVGAGLSSR